MRFRPAQEAPLRRIAFASAVALPLLMALPAVANPVILNESDWQRARIGLAVIFVLESGLAALLLGRAGLRWGRVFAPVLALNLATFALFAQVLIVYGRYEIGFAPGIGAAEAAIIVLEAAAFRALARRRWLARDDIMPALSFRRALLVAAICNVASLLASLAWHLAVELTAPI